MIKNEKVLARVKPISKIGNENILGCMKITHFSNEKSIKASFLATEFEFILFESSSPDVDIQIADRFFWDEIIRLSAPSDMRIKLETSESSIEFEVPNAFQVCLAMHTCCARLGGKCKLDSDRIKPQEPTPLWNLCQFKYNLFKRGIPLPQVLVDEIETALRQSYQKLDLHALQCSENYLPDLLSAFSDSTCFKEIVVPAAAENTNWNLICPFLKTMKNFETISFTEKLNNQIPQVVNSLIANKETKLSNINFIKSGINADNMPFFTQLITCRRFNKLTLIDAVENSYFDKFIHELSKTDAIKTLNTLCICDMPTLNIDSLMKTLQLVKVFEFHNCQVPIDSILPYLSNKNLQGIIVDGGYIIGKELDKIPISSSINNFTFTHVRWENYSLISMWCRILNHIPQNNFITMDLSYALTGPQSWSSFFQAYCASPAQSIKSINWSGNQISPVFLQFLAKCQNLSQVYLDDCYTAQTYNSFISPFAEMMKTNSCITDLYMRAFDDTTRADSSLSRFLEILSSNQAILYLDLSGQPLGEQGLATLATFISNNKNLKTVKFDGSLNVSIDSLMNFFNKIMQRGVPINIEWPFAEIAKLRSISGIPASNISKLRQLWKNTCIGGNTNQPLTDIEQEPDIIRITNNTCPANSPLDDTDYHPTWKFNLPPIPEPNNTQLFQNAASIYSINELLKRMKQN